MNNIWAVSLRLRLHQVIMLVVFYLTISWILHLVCLMVILEDWTKLIFHSQDHYDSILVFRRTMRVRWKRHDETGQGGGESHFWEHLYHGSVQLRLINNFGVSFQLENSGWPDQYLCTWNQGTTRQNPAGDVHPANQQEGTLRFHQEGLCEWMSDSIPDDLRQDHIQETDGDVCSNQGCHAAQLQTRWGLVGSGNSGELTNYHGNLPF